MARDDEDERALLAAWRAGDRERGNRLFRMHAGLVDRFLRTKLPDAAEDLAQKTFLGLVERRDKLPEGVSVRAYLLGIARNQLLMRLRSQARHQPRWDPQTYSIVDAIPDAAVAVARSSARELLEEAMRRIPLDQQTALELFYWEQLSLKEIAEVTGTTPQATKMRLSRGRARLRAALETVTQDEGLLHTASEALEKWFAAMPVAVAKRSSQDR